MFRGLVVAFGQAEQTYFGRLAQVEPDRADQVADVFDEENVHTIEVQLGQRVADLSGFEVAPLTGGDLDDPVAPPRQTIAVPPRGQIADQNGRPATTLQLPQSGLQERRLAAPGRADEVDCEDAAARQLGAHRLRDFVVGLEDAFGHRQADRPCLAAHLRLLLVYGDRDEVQLVAAGRCGGHVAAGAVYEWFRAAPAPAAVGARDGPRQLVHRQSRPGDGCACLLYTSDAADEEDSVDLGG